MAKKIEIDGDNPSVNSGRELRTLLAEIRDIVFVSRYGTYR
jgi:hypothetical protein